MPVVQVKLPARDEVEARALLYRSFKSLIVECMAVAGSPGHARSSRNEALRMADIARHAGMALYPGDRDVLDELRDLVTGKGRELSVETYAGRYAVGMKPKPPARRQQRQIAGESRDARTAAPEAPAAPRHVRRCQLD